MGEAMRGRKGDFGLDPEDQANQMSLSKTVKNKYDLCEKIDLTFINELNFDKKLKI
jgi:hypothetical protein